MLVTFDDGYRDTLTNAAPALVERGMSATTYVTTGVVGSVSPGGDPMLTWPQIGELAGMGHEIGAHSQTHPQLDTLSCRPMRREIAGSRARLQAGTGLPIESFAYPHGYSDARVRRAVREAGFTSAASVKNALSPPDDPLFTLARLMVMTTTTDDEFAGWLAGRGVPVGRDDERLLTRGWRWYRRARARVGAPRRDGPMRPDQAVACRPPRAAQGIRRARRRGRGWCLLRGEAAVADPGGDVDMLVARGRPAAAGHRARAYVGFLHVPGRGAQARTAATSAATRAPTASSSSTSSRASSSGRRATSR